MRLKLSRAFFDLAVYIRLALLCLFHLPFPFLFALIIFTFFLYIRYFSPIHRLLFFLHILFHLTLLLFILIIFPSSSSVPHHLLFPILFLFTLLT